MDVKKVKIYKMVTDLMCEMGDLPAPEGIKNDVLIRTLTDYKTELEIEAGKEYIASLYLNGIGYVMTETEIAILSHVAENGGHHNSKALAIKAVRERTGMDLKDAKALVEKALAEYYQANLGLSKIQQAEPNVLGCSQ